MWQEGINISRMPFEEYLKKNKIYRDLQRAYGHMKHGGKVIDIYEAFKTTGIGADSLPKIAIVRADATVCYFTKVREGAGVFSHIEPDRWGTTTARKSYGEIGLPAGTFGWDDINWQKAKHKTIVPIIPPAILNDKVSYALKNYYIFWEVESWELIPPKDPMLLKAITPNLYAVLATWDLTELERAIIKANIV